jgi:hypothetical protein
MKFQILIRVFCFVIALSTTNCVKDEVAIPSLECTQANLTVNRTVGDVRASADAIVAQYKFDDIIEAYVVSSDEHGNFFKTISFQTLATATQRLSIGQQSLLKTQGSIH